MNFDIYQWCALIKVDYLSLTKLAGEKGDQDKFNDSPLTVFYSLVHPYVDILLLTNLPIITINQTYHSNNDHWDVK